MLSTNELANTLNQALI